MGLTVLILQVCLSYSPFRKNLLPSCLDSPYCPEPAHRKLNRGPQGHALPAATGIQMGGWVDGGSSDKQVRHGLGMHHG